LFQLQDVGGIFHHDLPQGHPARRMIGFEAR
jgi:hypothetical protein